jgi:CelD/BcsL family acetyltransferase involved in cellulose biosynthesis
VVATRAERGGHTASGLALGVRPPAMKRLHAEMVPLWDVDSEHLDLWRDWVRRSGFEESAFHQPELLAAIGKSFPNCRLIIVRDDLRTIAFIPIELSVDGSSAGPVPMCDYQTVAVLRGEQLDIRAIMRILGLKTWRYTSAPETSALKAQSTYTASGRALQVRLEPEFLSQSPSLRSSRGTLTTLVRRQRKLEREKGKVEFHYDHDSEQGVARMLELKMKRLGAAAPFPDQVQDALCRILSGPTGSVRGVFCVLTAAGQEIAYGYDLACGSREFSWFQAYDDAYEVYSPGILFYLKLIERLMMLGKVELDLGPGGEGWKTYFANAGAVVSTGRVDCGPLRANVVRAGLAASGMLRRGINARPSVKG